MTFEKIGKVSKNSILYLQVATYFLFLGDLFIVCFFAVSFVTAYRYIHHRRKLEDAGCYTDTQIAAKIQRSIYKHVLCKYYLNITFSSTKKITDFPGLSPRHCGTLPFSFITWFVYSSFLVAKLCLISGEISHHMYGDGGFNVNQTTINEHGAVEGLNANMLKVAVGLSALIFIIMLQAHHNHDPDSPHSGYITGVCHNIAVEVFDSVTLISLLIVQDKNYSYLKIWNFNQLIVFLSSFNLILPTITMYSLSLSDFGRHLDRVIHIKVITQLLQLFVVNIPFFGVRIYLW